MKGRKRKTYLGRSMDDIDGRRREIGLKVAGPFDKLRAGIDCTLFLFQKMVGWFGNDEWL